MKNSTPSKLPQLLLLNFLPKFLTKRNYPINTSSLRGGNIFRCFVKFINSETNNKSTGNDDLAAEFYKHSNDFAPVLLDVYDSWEKLGKKH